MNNKNLTCLLFSLGALLALPLLLSACDTVGDEPIAATDTAPPAPEIENIPLIQDPQTHIWRPGYWALSGNSFVWISGRIIPRPSPTAVWASAHWVWHTYGWSFEQGHWE